MIIRARTVVTMDGAPIENGGVAVSKDRIVDVGSFDDVKMRNAGNTLDLGEQVLMPGFINAHCHLDYTCLRGKIQAQGSFADWIRAINAEKAMLSPKDYIDSINNGFAEARRFGTTTIANLTAFPELIPHIQPPLRTCWFPELIDVRAPERADKLVEAAIQSVEGAQSQPGRHDDHLPWGLAPHAPFTASEELFRRCEQVARRESILLTTHLAESHEEMLMFRDASGPLYEFLKNIGRTMDDCGNTTPLQLFLTASGGRAVPRWIVVHLNELAESDFNLLERSEPKLHIVHCPRSHKYFGHSQFSFERLRSLGFNISLGTDSLASNENLSLFDEMRAFQKNFPEVCPEEILRMVTVNPACALRQQGALGKTRRGACADLLAIPSSGDKVLEEIIAFMGKPWMMVAGQVIGEI